MQKKLFTFLFVIVASIGTINAQYETCDFECVYRDSIRTVFIPPTTFKYDTIKMFCGIEPCSNATRSGDIVIPDSIDCDGYIYSVYRIVNRAFAYCTGITSITCLPIIPPALDSNVFDGVDCSQIPLYVPKESVSAYKSVYGWKEFNPILPIGTQGIGRIADEHTTTGDKLLKDGKVLILRGDKIYTLQGQETK